MTWVKICGMTNLEDALIAVDAGADAVGFVFYEKSPRCVTVETAREICEKMPESVEKVGVFVGAAAETVIGTSGCVGLTAAQLYPDASGRFLTLDEEFFRNVQCDVIVASSAKYFGEGLNENEKGPSGFFLSRGSRHRILALLVDSGDADLPGGTGKRFDWKSGARIRDGWNRHGVRLIAAGGMTAENVADAIGMMRPWGIDVSSGVEASPGKKDPEKVRAFVRAVREFDRRVVG